MGQPIEVKLSLFPSTHWTEVVEAGQVDSPEGMDALDQLLRRYQPALKAHLRARFGLDDDVIDDLFQEFSAAKILKSGFLAKANPKRGKFRTFVLTALDNFCRNQLRSAKAQRRSPPDDFVGLDTVENLKASADTPHPSVAFDQAWAQQVMEETLKRMRTECQNSNRQDIWEVFVGRILQPLLEDAPPVSYRTLVKRHGYRSPDQAGNVLITGKRMFVRILRQAVSEYTSNENEIRREINDLKEILAGAGAWSGGGTGIKD
jgi:RNA polymerase sigma factor (sigma-70 family)